MDWNPGTWKSIWKNEKSRWLLLLAAGLICLLFAVPSGLESGQEPAGEESGSGGVHGEQGEAEPEEESAGAYEERLEKRLEEILSRVEGVGTAEVMIVLKSSEEKVWRVDRNTSDSVTQETDQNGGSRRVESRELSEETVLTGQGDGDGPLLEKKLFPEIGGVVVSADGGASPSVQAEISAAAEALFDLPSHKIKVLKRVE